MSSKTGSWLEISREKLIKNLDLILDLAEKSTSFEKLRQIDLRKNSRRFKSSEPKSDNLATESINKQTNRPTLAPCLKSNAYGHGLLEIASILESYKDVEFLTVFSLSELLLLKQQKIKKKILVLGFWQQADIDFLAKENLLTNVHFCCSTLQDLLLLEKISSLYRVPIQVHIFIDTGLHREGFLLEELPDLVRLLKQIKKHPFLKIVGLATHFATSKQDIANSLVLESLRHNSDSEVYSEDKQTKRFFQQQDSFAQAIALFEKENIRFAYIHQDSSGSTLQVAANHKRPSVLNLLRPGLICYGYLPNQQLLKRYPLLENLSPILSWKTRVTQVKVVRRGEYIGYGNDFCAEQDLLLAVLPVGYADGLTLTITNQSTERPYVLIDGQRYQFIGKICMNLSMVYTALHQKQQALTVGKTVTLLGSDGRENLSLYTFAKWQNIPVYEALVRLNPYLDRQIV